MSNSQHGEWNARQFSYIYAGRPQHHMLTPPSVYEHDAITHRDFFSSLLVNDYHDRTFSNMRVER